MFEPLDDTHARFAVAFDVRGQPQGKGRARSRLARARDGRQIVAHYTPSKTVEYEARVTLSAIQAMAGKYPTAQPVHVSVIAYVGIPASWSSAKRERAIAGLIQPTVKPDIDNVAKAILDGISGIVMIDDKQVVGMTMAKRYSKNPRVIVEAMEVPGESAS